MKTSLLKILIALVCVFLIIIGIEIYQFNTTSSNVEVVQTSSNIGATNFGVLDNNFYKFQDGKFEAVNKSGSKLFDIRIPELSKTVYDKYIYLVENTGHVQMINRSNGKQVRSIKIDSNAYHAEIQDNNLIVFSEDRITILNKKLEEIATLKDLNNPVRFIGHVDKFAVLELNQSNGNIISTYKIFEKGSIKFTLTTDKEIFLSIYSNADSDYLVSNSYIYQIKDSSIVTKKLVERVSAIEYKDQQIHMVDNMNLITFDLDLNQTYKKNVQTHAELLSIRKNSTIILSEESISYLENENLLSEHAGNWLDWSLVGDDLYLIYENKVVKVKTN